jgi:hypothetical protein
LVFSHCRIQMSLKEEEEERIFVLIPRDTIIFRKEENSSRSPALLRLVIMKNLAKEKGVTLKMAVSIDILIHSTSDEERSE